MIANTLECESTREQKFPRHFAPGVKVPGSELARVLLAPIRSTERIGSGAKGCESL